MAESKLPPMDRHGRILATDGKGNFRYMGEVEIRQNPDWRRATGTTTKAAARPEPPAPPVDESNEEGQGQEAAAPVEEDAPEVKLPTIPQMIERIKQATNEEELAEAVGSDTRPAVLRARDKRRDDLRHAAVDGGAKKTAKKAAKKTTAKKASSKRTTRTN